MHRSDLCYHQTSSDGHDNMTIEVPPSYEEQERIGEFFEALDNLITLHQREYFKQQTEAKNVKCNQRDGPFL